METTDGILLIDKPSGLTSFETLFALKRALGTRKVGHTGTLDKFATGLLIVAVGKGLKTVPLFEGMDKCYEAVFRFGQETETLDPEGAVVAEGPVPTREELEAALPRFRGPIMQAPPTYSAVHIDGKRAHELVRSGHEVAMKERPVTIHSLELVSYDAPLARVKVHCSKGTYIRSLARDIGREAGTRGYVTELRRTRVGGSGAAAGFDVADAVGTELDAVDLRRRVLPLDEVLFHSLGMSCVTLEGGALEALYQGRALEPLVGSFGLPVDREAAVFGLSGRLAAVIKPVDGRWKYRFVCGREP
jgi:tRNA pseudouridine55 synthase